LYCIWDIKPIKKLDYFCILELADIQNGKKKEIYMNPKGVPIQIEDENEVESTDLRKISNTSSDQKK